MLQAFDNKLSHLRPKSASVRNVLKLAGGTAGSQVITVAAAPIFTRLYGPESFGVLATFASILALLNVVSSLRYELAIAVPENDDEAIALVWLCMLLVGTTTVLTALGVVLLGNQMLSWLHQSSSKPLLWLLPVGVLIMGLYQALSYWAIRCKQYGLLAQSKLRQSIFGVSVSLVSAPLGAIGLLLGQIASYGAGFVTILKKSASPILNSSKCTLVILLNMLRRYRHFGIYSSLAGLINTIGGQAPSLIFASVFGAAQLGQFALAQQLLLLPAALIGSSVGQVFLGQASEHYRLGNLSQVLRQAATRLSCYGVALAVLIGFVLAPLIPLIFGDQWSETKSIILLLLPLFLVQIVVSPLSVSFLVSENLRSELMGQIALMLARILPLVICASLGCSFEQSIVAYSLSCVLGYASYAVLLFKASQSGLTHNS